MEAERNAIWREYQRGLEYDASIGLSGTVKNNENFFLGRQWEDVQAGGLPTPVFNFIKRAVLYLTASVAGNNLKLNVTPLDAVGKHPEGRLELASRVVNAEFARIFELNKLPGRLREVVRNAAVDGDGCLYAFFNPDRPAGQYFDGEIELELIENTRVFFGNPYCREVEKQPFILIASRRPVDEIRRRAAENGLPGEDILPDGDGGDGRATLLLKLWKQYGKDGRQEGLYAAECVKGADVRPPWKTGLTRYPLAWLNWDFVPDSYHGQAAVSGIIPNQIFVNKLFAMAMISLMATAYPKIIYDKTRIGSWDNRVGAAVGVLGGDMQSAARVVEPAAMSPQIAQFIQMTVSYTREFLGANDAALGDVRPDNTSAILALQQASSLPLEGTRQALYQFVEDLGRVFLDMMAAYYGKRTVMLERDGVKEAAEFDFACLRQLDFSLKLDVGASAYWSEIASLQTLDNLLASGKIDILDYLERLPDGYVSRRQELIEAIRGKGAGE